MSQTEMSCVGVDIFIISKSFPVLIENFKNLKLEMISDRGMQVWPGELPEGNLGPWYRLRYRASGSFSSETLNELLKEIEKSSDWEKVQKLFSFQGKDQFSKAYGS